ncbi:MAG TPA: hypothetical protein VIG24_14235 [Acidimicrobiia bacterium]
MTEGEYRVGINFNPSADDAVGRIKSMAAALIDFIEGLPTPEPGEHAMEVRRLKSLAQTEVESAAMWAVKAATKPAPDTEV